MAMYNDMDTVEIDGIVKTMSKEKEEKISPDGIINYFGEIAKALRAADPDMNRAELIVEGLRQFYIRGYRDGLRKMWNHFAVDPDEEEPDEDEAHRLTMEDLGL